MSFRDDAVLYFEVPQTWPFMRRIPSDDNFDGNAILYTGIYFKFLELLGEQNATQDLAHIFMLYYRSQVEPGLINRGKDNLSMQKHDDYIGLCAAAQVFSTKIAQEIYDYGHSHGWYYNNMKGLPVINYGIGEWLSCFFWRLPGVVQHMKICASVELNIFDRFWWTIGVAANAFSKNKKNASGTQLTWLMVEAYKKSGERHNWMDWAADKFETSLKKKYVNGMGDVFQMFFQMDYDLKEVPTHIFARYGKLL